MTGEMLREAERALDDHGAFERLADDGGPAFALRTSPFEATVRLLPAGGLVAYAVTVRVPTLDAVVRGEEVAPVIQEGWLDTFTLRLEDVGGATRADPEPPLVRLDRDAGQVVVETAFETGFAAHGADDAKAVADYVEGTYLEGVVPGYDYGEPVAGMLERALGGTADG